MTPEEQPISDINSHIEEYLDYYCGLSHAPGFAVLLKGEWGCGKTWFINKYREKLEKKIEKKKQKCLYVSLYGMTSFSDIEDVFFQQLHPVLSSKGMAITGKILKGVLKGTLKIDLDSDTKDDGTVNIQIPEINLPDYLKNTDKSILIFDDLERCQIDIGNLLGYINYFVEHQDLKVILVANEDKLYENKNNNYQEIKEKLIGKTFDVCIDLDGALKEFIQECEISKVRTFLSKNIALIEELYQKAEYENLRSLKGVILDFERIFEKLPDKAKDKTELLQDFLKVLMAFSIEIKRGNLLAKNIINIESPSNIARRKLQNRTENAYKESSNSVNNKNTQEADSNFVEQIIDKYKFLGVLLYDPIPSLEWWQIFFDKGIINTQELEESILNSKYFQDENTPNWIRLWHFYDTDINDDEFHALLKKVESEYADRQFIELGEIFHVTGVFLNLCDIGLYPNKTKQDLLQDAKDYINDLVKKDRLALDLIENSNNSRLYSLTGYKGLGYQGIELEEFKEFNSYIIEVQQSALEKKLPQFGLELLNTLQSDRWKFHRMLCINDFSDRQEWNSLYYKIPILKYIAPQDFMDRFLSMNFDYQRSCLWTFSERYKAINITQQLREELKWLQTIQDLLLHEIEINQGKLIGYRLKILNEDFLNKTIKKLEN